MAVLSGFVLEALPVWTRDHLNMVPLDVLYDALYEDREVSDLTAGVSGVTAELAPVDAVAAGARQGALAVSFFDDFYNRVHVIPAHVDLGNVVSTQVSVVTVWNAWMTPRTLESIGALAQGVDLTGETVTPVAFPPLLQRDYTLSVTPDGSPALDTSVVFNFDTESPAVRVTANRIAAWTFVPDWTDGVVERLIWATDVLQSESLAEQRRALLPWPRREFDASVYVEGRDRQYFDMALFGWGDRIWAIPIWHELQLLSAPLPADSVEIPCSTADLEFRAGGLAMLRGETPFLYEVVEVDSVAADRLVLKRPTQRSWPAGTRLYPSRTAFMGAEPKRARITDTLMSADLTFRLVNAVEVAGVAPETIYRGRPVLEARPNENDTLTHEFARLMSELDSGTASPRVTNIAGRALPMMSYRWIGSGRAERCEYRALLHYLRGRQRSIWVPTHADDLTVAAIVSADAMTIDVVNVGYTRFGLSAPGRRDIRIELVSGAALHRRIVGSTELSADVERLAIDAAPGVTIDPADVVRVSWIALFRGDSDSVEITHYTDSEGVAESQLVFRGVRDDDL